MSKTVEKNLHEISTGKITDHQNVVWWPYKMDITRYHNHNAKSQPQDNVVSPQR